ncbi:LuxR C-terminal-related transcriptional regulator [Dyadobacter sp. 676]|uniref:LuxR C-terminal-related transcriptional regulator n=1 Tax=Dyadobacter sp. 676 TaxID=3088362 RepID=A0AAU8FFH3_9BACT
MTTLIVTENLLFALGMRVILEENCPGAWVLETGTVKQATDLAMTNDINLLVLDITVNGGKDFSGIMKFRESNPGTFIIAWLGGDPRQVFPLLRIGVNGVFSNKAKLEEIRTGLKVCEPKTRFVSNDLQQILLAHLIPSYQENEMTARERLIADLLAENKSRFEIASIAGIKPNSVGFYKRKIYGKLGVKNVVELNVSLNKLAVARH